MKIRIKKNGDKQAKCKKQIFENTKNKIKIKFKTMNE